MLALASRSFQTSSQVQDVDSAAKFIGAGAATVGVAGQFISLYLLNLHSHLLVHLHGVLLSCWKLATLH